MKLKNLTFHLILLAFLISCESIKKKLKENDDDLIYSTIESHLREKYSTIEITPLTIQTTELSEREWYRELWDEAFHLKTTSGMLVGQAIFLSKGLILLKLSWTNY